MGEGRKYRVYEGKRSMKQMNKPIHKERERVEWCGSGDFVFLVSFVLGRAILPDPAAANDPRQPVNDLMTMSRDGAHPTRIDFGNSVVDKV